MKKDIVLSDRLQALADMVTAGSRVCDVGCDHGFVPVYLVKHGISPKVIAMDVNAGPLERAIEHIKAYGVEAYIETRLSDGLRSFHGGEADSLICAGMGGRLMMRILEDDAAKTAAFKELILQPQSELQQFRCFLRSRGYLITEENMIEEDGKFYPMMKAVKGRGESLTRWESLLQNEGLPQPERDELIWRREMEDRYGALLLQKKPPVLYRYLEREKRVCEEILKKLRVSGNDSHEKDRHGNDGHRKNGRYEAVERQLVDCVRVMEWMKSSDYEDTRRVCMVRIRINGEEKLYEEGIKYEIIAKEHQHSYRDSIALVIVDGKIRELMKRVDRDCELSFATYGDSIGHKTYVRSAIMLLMKAIADVAGIDAAAAAKVEFAIGAGYYCRFRGDFSLDDEQLVRVKERMRELVEADIPVTKKSYQAEEAVKLFEKYGMTDKVKLFRYRRSSTINVYCLGDYYDYYYGYMLPSTGYIRHFDLLGYEDGMILLLPEQSAPDELPGFEPRKKLFQTLMQSCRWGEQIGIDTVGDLNDQICQDNIADMILVQEALQERRIGEIARDIARREGVKFVMIAGPSSSGKTTFSHRLSIQLRTYGLQPHPIGLDNYYVNHGETPLDENGNPDFECIEALDVEQFNRDMGRLLAGESVELPTFNFKTGRREYNGKVMTLGKDDILVIEGIHGLNEKMSYSLPAECKYKIYISALTSLNIDEHNRIPTTDSRLLRRMVRDARTRGASAKRTIEMWSSVRRGEEKYIFPFQEQADAMFNSALIYELAVLKQYAEPLLFNIKKGEPEYHEAKRLLKFLEYFLGVSSENLPTNSLCREFVGGSCFEV